MLGNFYVKFRQFLLIKVKIASKLVVIKVYKVLIEIPLSAMHLALVWEVRKNSGKKPYLSGF